MDEMAVDARKRILDLTYKMGHVGAHVAPSLSLVDILVVLFRDVMDFSKDLFVLSKGHGGLGYYVALYEAGRITEEELNTFEDNGGDFPGQPSKNIDKSIVYSSGSLGLGLSYAVGRALKHEGTVYVLMGDGELNEGTIWEAAMFAGFHKMTNIVGIVDFNRMQSDGASDRILSYDIGSMWRSLNWNVATCDGHDANDIRNALETESDKPLVVIANTVKGKGVSFMEGNPQWHHGHLTEAQYQQAIDEVLHHD